MSELMQALGPFIYGFVAGYFWHPIWEILKRIWSEAKKAREEW